MIKIISKTLRDIKSIKIQGATNVAKASIEALAVFGRIFKGKNPAVFLKEVERVARNFYDARPDEPLNQNLLSFVVAGTKESKGDSVKEKAASLEKYSSDALKMISKNEDLITASGVALVRRIQKKRKRSINIFTHCHSSSMERILIEAHKKKIPFKVYNSETRPRFQGRITAENLTKAGISVTMMVDDAAAFIFSKNDPDNINIDLVIVGADVISKEGAILNKIGSYSLALSAEEAGIPFYTAVSLLKLRHDFASYRDIVIEKRDPDEVYENSIRKLKIINYAFDIVPSEYITGFITEFGIVKPKDVKKTAVKKYKKFFK